jgi:hypothetical protein
MSRPRSEHRENYWRAVISRQAASDESIASFCRENNLSAASFYSWRRKLAARPAPAPQFVPVPLVKVAAEFQVRLSNGVSVVVPADFDDMGLRRLLSVACSLEANDA